MTANKTDSKNTVTYRRPELTVYGSVRNLTGGSSGSQADGTGIRTIIMV